MSRRLRISPEVVARQRQAADPTRSVWVRANAGSGKTHVLTERVLRLLLAGVRPEEILCLTYTKAAAAEMRRRVSAQLAEWALLPDDVLAGRLAALEGRPPAAAARERARTLFAHALETPGGLKINTIHAFCESVLHRFPLEAGVPFDFAVIEEAEAEDMVLRARETVLAEGLRADRAITPAVDRLFEQLSDFSIAEAIGEALAQGRRLRPILADRPGAKARLRTLLKLPPELDSQAVRRAIERDTLLLPGDCRAVVALCRGDPAGSRFADLLARTDLDRPAADALLEAFLKADREPRKTLLGKSERAAEPALATRLDQEQQRLAVIGRRLVAVELAERSEALLDVLGAIVDRYEAEKRSRSRLDFDDLVRRAADLFADEPLSAWVRYKLDAGITHILVDESQDTNPEQWRVVDALAAEFFHGDSAVERPRSLFAVGDEKQSIYSFQGADPRLFGASGRRYARAARQAGQPFLDMELHTSFRTLSGVLAGVDLVFRDPRLRRGVLALEAEVGHDTARAEGGGTVTLWPPVAELEDAFDPDNWPLEPPQTLQGAPRRLAERIAGEIRGWLDTGRPLGPRGRPVRPEDILILVQSRSNLFHELIRALGRRGIPTPGADRLPVTGHVAVLDLLALGDVLLNPADDLQLAALLRSPLFDLSEDELYRVAMGREGSLWHALGAAAVEPARAARERLAGWRARLDLDRPFEFYAAVLHAGGGLRRFYARLGAEVDDVMAEFLALALAHEQSGQPSLQGFLAAMRSREVSIRRELAEAAGGVRVMTVHGAKGLEAPIVILADAASRPQGRQVVKPVYLLSEAPGPLLVHASRRETHTAETGELRAAVELAENEEYWRRLYVGMTRAEDELYVTGYLTRRGGIEGSWYEAVDMALGAHCQRLEDAGGELQALVYPAVPDRPAMPEAVADATTTLPLPLVLPPLPRPRPLPLVTPSTAHGAAHAPERALATTLESIRDAEAARREGLALHALLQHLGRMPRAQWPKLVDKALVELLPEAPERHAEIGRKAVSILANPAFSLLFGPDSRAEVPFLVEARRDGAPVRLAGRIDRLVVDNGRVLVVDYKSDANPPGDASEVPASYLMQVGLYAHVASQLFPGQVVEAGILWTTLESLMVLPSIMLRDAVSAFTMR